MQGTLGPYRLDRELGAGGMGKVYAARVEGRVPGLETGSLVALKVVHPHLLETPGFFKRFLREAEIGKSVVHENVVRTYDCDAVMAGGAQQNFLVMEYVEGQTLRGLLAELERVPEELCRHIGREVAKGLAAVHAAGVVHRDMKPENVLITKDHAVKVMDLGVARLHDEALRLSQTGAFVGSIHYSAPECFEDGGRNVDGRADLHALGLVLYELACGVNPYFAESVADVLKRVLHEMPRRAGDVNPQLSPFFEEVVHCLLAKQPADRFADASVLLGVLEAGEESDWWKSRAKAIRAVTHQPLRRIRVPRETAVYGRENDLAKLRGFYEKAKAGDGRVVVIEGEAGIGKSRVVDELIGRLQRDGEELNFLFGSYPPGGAATASGAFSTAFREQFGSDGSAAYLTPSPVLVPAFDALLKGEPTPTGVESLTREALQTCFVHSIRGLAAERPTVLLIDDLHFAGEDARALFTSLAMAVPGNRILLVGTTRPGIDEKWLAGLTRLPQTALLQIERLFPKDLTALLKDSLKSETLALTLAGQIAQKSDGNPFFVFEIIRGLREGQFLTQKGDGTWVSTRVIDDIQIPSSILDLVNARVADLTQEERDLLDMAACCGFEFDPALIAEAVGEALVPTLKRFAAVEKKHRLVRASGRKLIFDHHQVQEALYGSLYEQMREAYHATLASALETRAKCADKDPTTLDGALCVELCEHFLKGAQGERALRYLAAAQRHLTRGYLHEAAARLAETALAASGLLSGAERAKALLRLADSLNRLGRRSRQEEVAREAERLAEESGDEESRGRAASALAWCLLQGSRLDDSAAAYRRALEIAVARADKKAQASAENGLGLVARSQGRFAEAVEHHERGLALCREIGDRNGEASALGNLGGTLEMLGRIPESYELELRAIALSREMGNRQAEATFTGNLGLGLLARGRLEEAREHVERGVAIHRETGDRTGEGLQTSNLGVILTDLDRDDEAREHLVRGWQTLVDAGSSTKAQWNLPALVGVELRQRRRESARALLSERLELARRIGDVANEALALVLSTRLQDADVEAAERAFAAHAELIDPRARMDAALRLHEATSKTEYLAEAKRLLDASVSQLDAQDRASVLTKVRLSREVAAAARAAGL